MQGPVGPQGPKGDKGADGQVFMLSKANVTIAHGYAQWSCVSSVGCPDQCSTVFCPNPTDILLWVQTNVYPGQFQPQNTTDSTHPASISFCASQGIQFIEAWLSCLKTTP
jgi:hypothetical protein